MSGYEIPVPIQEEIMKSLPVKSLIRFRSVSKAWKSLIDSSQFITAHSLLSHPHYLLVSNRVSNDDVRYFSSIDDTTFPQKLSVPTVPLSVKKLLYLRVLGSSHGLICVCGCDPSLKNGMAVLWNPSIRKSVVVPLSEPYPLYLGFGVCPATGDPKLLLMEDVWTAVANGQVLSGQVASVYTLSSGIWRSLSTTMPYRDWSQRITTKKFIYSLQDHYNKIMSFDLAHETFEAIDLPDGLASHQLGDFVYMSNIRESLALIKRQGDMCAVWMLEDDGSFKNLFNINTLSKNDSILGFAQNGMPIMLLINSGDDVDDDDDDFEPPSLAVCEPNSKRTNYIEISGLTYGVHVLSYMETLLLLDCNSDCGTI